jgi:hypothetical protein
VKSKIEAKLKKAMQSKKVDADVRQEAVEFAHAVVETGETVGSQKVGTPG